MNYIGFQKNCREPTSQLQTLIKANKFKLTCKSLCCMTYIRYVLSLNSAGRKILKIVLIKMNILRSFWNSPTDLKTTHFWDPAFNWSLPFAVDCYLALYYIIKLIICYCRCKLCFLYSTYSKQYMTLVLLLLSIKSKLNYNN